MGLTEEEFFGQSVIFWNDRLNGFVEMHGGKDKDPGEPFTEGDMYELEELMAESEEQSAPA